MVALRHLGNSWFLSVSPDLAMWDFTGEKKIHVDLGCLRLNLL